MMAFSKSSDLRFLSELPETTVQNIYIDYLFNEFIYRYELHFRYTVKDKLVSLSNLKFRRFLVQFLHNLEPRRYLEMEKIQD